MQAGQHSEVADEEVKCVRKMLGQGANVIKMIKWNEEISNRLRLPFDRMLQLKKDKDQPP